MMGGRLSVPKNADHLSEASPAAARAPKNFRLNGRTIMAPVAAFTMAGLLFFYSRTSIQAARLNAQKHREADGGQLNWRKESLRRHGAIEKVGDGNVSLVREASRGDKKIVRAKEAAEMLEAEEREAMLGADSPEAKAIEDAKKSRRGF